MNAHVILTWQILSVRVSVSACTNVTC